MRIMALDFGEKNIGIALSDPLRIMASGLLTLKRESIKKDLLAIHILVEKHRVEELVMGLPLNMDGSSGEKAREAEAFGRRLKGRIRVPVVFWDERLSTLAAERVLLEADVRRKSRREVIDKMAAVVILQNYLDARQAREKDINRKGGQ